jgi:DNA-binding Xre family transcriptional regulator
MRLKINELRGRMADQGRSVSLQDVEDATGISRAALTEISKGRARRLIPEYIDALCVFFGVEAGELVEAEPVQLPLSLNIRPDRRGQRVGTRTRKRTLAAEALEAADDLSAALDAELAIEQGTEAVTDIDPATFKREILDGLPA